MLAVEKIQVVESRSIRLVVSIKTIEMGGVHSKMGVASKILRALRAQQYNRNPLQEILDLPLSVLVSARGGEQVWLCLHKRGSSASWGY